MSRQHAVLSASAAKRWLECTPAPRFEEQFEEEHSDFAEEGTLAHSYAEVQLRHRFESAVFDLAHIKASQWFNEAMVEHIKGYVELIQERFNEARARSTDALIFFEQRLDFSEWVPDGFGTGDVVIIADNVLEVIDLKYGKGVPVDAAGNPQLMLYGLGAYHLYGMLYDFDTVRTTIVQPRLDSISSANISLPELLKWAIDYVKPRAALAIKGEGEFVAGDHCRFCRAKAVCKARAMANLDLLRYDFRPVAQLTDAEIAEILFKVEPLVAWAEDVQHHAQREAEAGKHWPGWKLVEGRSNRKYSDEVEVANTLLMNGFNEQQIYTKDILGITAMEKLTGKKAFADLLGPLVIKPPGRPTLVPETDLRPELATAAKAADDFKEE